MGPQETAELKKLVLKAGKLATQDGMTSTEVPYFSIIKSSKPTPLRHGVLTPSFCVVLQGSKKVQIGNEILKYGAGTYLAAIVDMPTSGQIVNVTKNEPYLGLKIDYTMDEISSIVYEAKLNLKNRELSRGAFTVKAHLELLETFSKVFKLLDKPEEIHFFAPLIKKELLYRLLTSESGHLFYQNLILDPKTMGIGKAINWIRTHFDKPLIVEELARESHMSISSLHHKFKAFASMGPLQYQKQLRLQEARRLLFNGEEDATTVALRVGYESPSQFSREYRRLFGLPPMKDVKELRQQISVD